MGENSRIEWTTHTFNPWRGCTKVSPGCGNCYAERQSNRNHAVLGTWGPNGTRVVAAEATWREPLKWDREAKAACQRRRVFCASLADVFDNWSGTLVDARGWQLFQCCQCQTVWAADMSDYDPAKLDYRPVCQICKSPGPNQMSLADVRRRLFGLIEQTPNLDWLLLTKRPENVSRMTYDAWCPKVSGHVSQNNSDGRRWAWPANVWLGVSVEDQQYADERIPLLLKTPAAIRFLSAEPLLGPVDVWKYLPIHTANDGVINSDSIHWVIVGGESGPGHRPCEIAWIRSLVDQCREADVPCFVKQDSGHRPGTQGRITDDLWAVKQFPIKVVR